jgi:glycosyltransferase involved in cell wall biosynthesis
MSEPVRSAVYNRFWHSQGGGERHAGMVAEVLSTMPEAGDVELIGHTPVDLAELGSHLGLDLGRCTYRQIPDRGDAAMAAFSSDYDFWLTASYMSRLAPKARRSAYLCWFPTPFDLDLAPWRKKVAQVVGPYLRGPAMLTYGGGWYPPEGGRRRRWVWSSGDATLSVPPGKRRRLRMAVGRPGAPGGTQLSIRDVNDREVASVAAGTRFSRVSVGLPASERGDELRFVSEAFAPGGDDVRELGVAISRAWMQADGPGLRAYASARLPWLARDPNDLAFLSAYDAVLANSDYTRGWIERLWKRDAAVLHPPIEVDRFAPAAERDQLIVTVGRFFSPGLGHAKRQLEMVQWFGELHRAGRLPGWRLAVVGGCEDSQLPYLAQVRAAGADLPVEVHPNAPRPLVEQLLSTAAIFWSATGYGERDDQPWAAEHFGMTTVEAMAGGCVPVVIDKAGQREIITPGIDGFRWSTPQELMRQTEQVAADGVMRARMSTAATARSATFSDEAFAQRWRQVVADFRLLG